MATLSLCDPVFKSCSNSAPKRSMKCCLKKRAFTNAASNKQHPRVSGLDCVPSSLHDTSLRFSGVSFHKRLVLLVFPYYISSHKQRSYSCSCTRLASLFPFSFLNGGSLLSSSDQVARILVLALRWRGPDAWHSAARQRGA